MTSERAVLFALMWGRRYFDELIKRGLNENYFTGVNREIFLGVCEARDNYSDDRITILMFPKKREYTISQLMQVEKIEEEITTVESIYLPSFKELQETYFEREVKKRISQIKSWDGDSIIELADKLLALTEGHKEEKNIDELVTELTREIERRHSGSYQNKYRTGLKRYDKLGHFEPGSLVIIAGKSGHGKSSLAINLANRWLDNGLRILYITYEMTRAAVLGKLTIARTGVEWNKVFKSKDIEITDEEYKYVMEGVKWYRGKPILIVEEADTPAKIEYYIRKFKADVFVIDTINFLTSESAQFWIKLGNLASAYKRLAVKYNILGVMLAQGSNFTGRPTRKELLAESKKMKDSADYIDFVYREKEEAPTNCTPQLENALEIYRVKGRFTGTGYSFLYFSGKNSQVRDLEDFENQVVTEVLHGKR